MRRQRREIIWDVLRRGASPRVRRWVKSQRWFNPVARTLFGTTVYSQSYYDAIERIEGASVGVIGGWIADHLRPQRAVDVGCGPGHQMAALAGRGIGVYGVDIADAALRKVKEKGLPADRYDLTGPDPLPGGPYDLAVCCEVAEHLPAEAAPVLVRRLAAAAPVVFLTAAEHDPEIGPGLLHVNEQPNRYWIDLMRAEAGMTLDEPLTAAARTAFADAGVIKYLAKPMIFRRPETPAPPAVSVVILTHNEERNLADCLASAAGFVDVHVLDSGSTDRTAAVAAERGVPVHVHAFRGFGTQRNWAIDHIPTKYPWQLHLDADERLTPELTAELVRVAGSDPPHGGYRVPSRLMFAGRWLKRAGQYPAYQVRFFRKDRLRFADHGHGQREVTEHPVGTLHNPLVHHGFSKGVDDWFAKHVRYARREAEQALRPGGVCDRLLSRDGTERRRAVKRLAARLPGRYLLRLAHLLVWRRAVLDGWAGITYAHMVATYESMIDVYLRLLARDIDPDRLTAPPADVPAGAVAPAAARYPVPV